jgi:hypothetical protein
MRARRLTAVEPRSHCNQRGTELLQREAAALGLCRPPELLDQPSRRPREEWRFDTARRRLFRRGQRQEKIAEVLVIDYVERPSEN